MTETWIDWAIKRPCPPGYDGYPHDPGRELSEIKYIVNHSAEGFKPSLILGHRPGQPASWTFSVMLDGELYQHLPLEALAYTSGSYQANRDGIGREHEGKAPNVITPEQVATDRRLDKELQGLCPNLRPLAFGEGYREHGELTNGATSCPSGRIQPLYDSYSEEEHVGLTEDQNNKLNNVWQVVNELATAADTPSSHPLIKRIIAIENRVAELEAAGGGTTHVVTVKHE
jgi:hypothetical protein